VPPRIDGPRISPGAVVLAPTISPPICTAPSPERTVMKSASVVWTSASEGPSR
jgi:hypothetical protein